MHSESYGALDLHQGFGARLTDNGDLPLERFGQQALYREERGEKKKRERDTPHREVERRLDGAVLAQVPKTQRDRDTETDRPKQKRQTAKTKQNQCKLEKKIKPNITAGKSHLVHTTPMY